MKRTFEILLVFILILAFTSCGNTSNGSSRISDVNSLCVALKDGLEFGDVLEESDMEFTLSKYGIDPSLVTELSRYTGSGFTADEVAVLRCADGKAVNSVVDALSDRVSYLHDGYSDYGPQEVPKIDSAKILEYGDCVVFVICNNSEMVESIVSQNIG